MKNLNIPYEIFDHSPVMATLAGQPIDQFIGRLALILASASSANQPGARRSHVVHLLGAVTVEYGEDVGLWSTAGEFLLFSCLEQRAEFLATKARRAGG